MIDKIWHELALMVKRRFSAHNVELIILYQTVRACKDNQSVAYCSKPMILL